MSIDLIRAHNGELGLVAAMAFVIGLKDAQERHPKKPNEVMGALERVYGSLGSYRAYHVKRLYEVYMAGRNLGIQNEMARQKAAKDGKP